MSAANRAAVRYSLYDVTSENARTAGGLNATSRGTALEDRDHSLAVNWLSTRSSAFVNELRAQAGRSRLAAPPNDAVGPAVTIAGVANFGTSTSAPTGRDLDLFELSDSYTLHRGTHMAKAGATLLSNG